MQKLTGNKYFRVAGLLIGITIMVVVIVRPSVWDG